MGEAKASARAIIATSVGNVKSTSASSSLSPGRIKDKKILTKDDAAPADSLPAYKPANSSNAMSDSKTRATQTIHKVDFACEHCHRIKDFAVSGATPATKFIAETIVGYINKTMLQEYQHGHLTM